MPDNAQLKKELSFEKKLYGHFQQTAFNCLEVTKPLQRDNLPLPTKFPECPGTHLINLRRIKGWVNLGATHWF